MPSRLVDVTQEPGASKHWLGRPCSRMEEADHRVSPMDDPKLTAIGEYLHAEFPGQAVHCFEDTACAGWLFRIDDTRGNPAYWLLASNDYLKNHTAETIDDYLQRHQVGRRLMAAVPALLRLMNEGPRIR